MTINTTTSNSKPIIWWEEQEQSITPPIEWEDKSIEWNDASIIPLPTIEWWEELED